eukprot:1177157-Heterocapsa_arctica.AAC.1
MVSRLSLTIGWGAFGVYSFDIVLPPILVVSTSAEHIRQALRSRQVAGVFAAVKLLASLSEECIELDETGAAQANVKLHAQSLMNAD